MKDAGYILFAALLGAGSAFQVSLLVAMGRERGAAEAAWVSILASVTGAAAVISVRALRGDVPVLPGPFDRAFVVATVGIMTGTSLALSLRGIAPYFGVTGLFGVLFLVTAPVITPRLGIGLFVSVTLAGQLVGAVLLDHVGALGAEPHRIDLVRVLGIIMLFAGVVLIRSR